LRAFFPSLRQLKDVSIERVVNDIGKPKAVSIFIGYVSWNPPPSPRPYPGFVTVVFVFDHFAQDGAFSDPLNASLSNDEMVFTRIAAA
jgi:hypothetical protein